MPYRPCNLALTCVLVCLAVKASHAQTVRAEKRTEITIPAIVATVGDHRITRHDLLNEIDIVLKAAAARAQFMAVKFRTRYGMPRMTPQRHEEIVNFLIERDIIDRIVAQEGIRVTQEEVDARLDKGKLTLQTDANYTRYLGWFDTSTGDIRESIRQNILAEKLVLLRGEDCSVTEEEVKEVYKQWNAAGRMTIGKSIDFWLITVAVDHGADEAGWETAKEKIRAAKKRVIEGEDFSAVAREVSDDTRTTENGGLFMGVLKDRLPLKFRKVMYRLDIGEISEPTRVDYGWHIFKVKKRRDPVTVPYEAAEKRLRRDLVIRCARAAVQREIDKVREQLEVVIHYRPKEALPKTRQERAAEPR